MKHSLLPGMAEALALTKAGRLGEAARLIQAALAPQARHARSGPLIDAGEVIEATWKDVTTSDGVAARADDASTAQFIDGEFSNAAGRRRYKLFVPALAPAARPPLVVMLHGCRQNPDDFAVGTRMNHHGALKGSLVLYPAQSTDANPSGCWNWFRTEHQRAGAGEPSILAGMTHEVMQRYEVDPSKVFVAGLSAGGAMAAVLAVTHPDLYAAVGIHSGLAFGSAHDLPSALAAMKGPSASLHAGGRPHATPTIVFHGDRDSVVHPHNGAAAIAASAHFEGGPGGSVQSDQGRSPGGHAYTRSLHRDADGQVMLEHWLVHGGGHAWFGGDRAGSYSDARGPDASAEMMRFFLERAA
jgi:poly(hydroxyalkanoate) depolymerase family esterase